MGLSATASRVIWLAAIIGAAAVAIDTTFAVAEELQEARELREELAQGRTEARFSEARFCWDGTLVRVMATNAGETTLDTLNVTILVDGLVVTGFVPDVDGEAPSGNWAPGLPATFNASYPSDPARVTFLTAEGARAYAEEVVCPVLDSIVVTPSTASMDIGETKTFSALGYDQFGALFEASPYTFTSPCGTVVQLTDYSASFTAGTVSGACILTATSGAVSGTATITIDPDAPVSAVVSPSITGVAAGGTQAFTVVLRDQYNNINTTATVTWSTNAGSISVGGVLTAQTTPQMGRSVTATSGAASGVATVDVYPAAPSTITVSPTSVNVNTQLTQQFTATVRDAYNNLNTTAVVTWSATRGSVSAAGLYTAPTTVGADTVTATSGAASGQASVTVRRAIHLQALATYSANVTDSTFKRGVETAEVRGTILDHLGDTVSGASVTVEWRRPNTNLDHTDVVTTTGAGLSHAYWVVPNGATQGTWTAVITAMSGTDLYWDSAADAVSTTVSFSVTN